MPRRKSFKSLSLVIVGLLVAATVALISPSSAGALQPPWSQQIVTTNHVVHVICRAYGGSISANNAADQDLEFATTAPDGVHEGESFAIKIRPSVGLFPRDDRSSVTAVLNNSYNAMSVYQLPAGVTPTSISLGPINGNVEANPEAGYYVHRDNVPHSVVAGVGDIPNPNFDPMTLSPSLRLPIPGIAPNAFFNATTRRLYTTLLGSGTGGSGNQYTGGSALQGPTVTVNVTANAGLTGTDLQVKLAGQLPGSEPRNYGGTQPNNFPAPASNASLTSASATAPWVSTNGTRYTYTDSVWTDPSYMSTNHATALGFINVDAKAACAPGYESTPSFPTAPAYYTGPGAIPNGTSPPISHTMVVQDIDTNGPVITVTAPIEGANYVAEQSVTADYDCNDAFGSGDDTCVGDVADGQPIDMSLGAHTFTVNALDLAGNPSQTVVNYNVVPNQNPVADDGTNLINQKTGNVITLDASASTDPDGPPAQALSYTWTQTSGHPVTLSNVNAQKPTFTIPPAPDFVYPHTLSFQVKVDDPYGGTHTSDGKNVQVTATAPTISAITRNPSGTVHTGTTLTLGATVTNPDGGALTYAWSQVSGRTQALSSNSVANPTFNIPSSGAAPTTTACTSGTGVTGPAQANCPRFQATVTATATGAGTSAAVALAAYASTLPTRPVANAGAAQNVASAGGLVTLNGLGSTQAQSHTLSYAWSQTAGPAVTLSSNSASQPTFTLAPGGGSATSYGFSLVVTDTQSPITSGASINTSLPATTTVTQVSDAVVANAGPDQGGKIAGNVITLDASASTDPNLGPLTYLWEQVANGAPTVTLSDATAQKPTFTAPPATTNAGYTAQFNVTATNGGPNAGDTDVSDTPVSITVASSTPVVTAVTRAPSGTVFTGDLITLGATITNPDGTAPGDYTYLWSQASGRTTTLSSTTAANPTYILPSSGTNPTGAVCTSGTGATSPTSVNCPRFQVVVTKINTAKSSVAVALPAHGSTLATRPVANAGTDQNVKVGSGTITLDGGHTQAQNHAVTYAWSQTAGPAVTLSPSSTATDPTFTAPITPATYTFSLVVTDTQSTLTTPAANNRVSAADAVTITVSNYASPIVSQGPNQSVNVGEDDVQLDGSASQADNHALTYLWSQTAGTPVTLSDNTILNPTFDAPNAGTTLRFTLTATDTENPNPAAATTVSPELVIGVGDFAAPVANPGPQQTVHRRDVVALDATGSSQVDGHELSYHWDQTDGVPVTLSDADVAQPTFTAPETPGPLKFTVTVTDTQNPNALVATVVSSEVQIDVQDYTAPEANAGPNQTNIDIDDIVTLDGSASSQLDNHALTYLWTQVDNGAPTVTLSDATAQKPTFIAPIGPATLQFELVVDDTFNSSAPDTVFIDVNGIAGLDFAANLEGKVNGVLAASTFTINVVNNGVLTRTITAGTLSAAIKKNGIAVPSSQTVITAKSVSLTPGKAANFTMKWNHGTTSLFAGDLIEIKTCVNVLGDSNPSNNCSTKLDPPGFVKVFAWPADDLTISARAAKSSFHVWLTNISSFAVGPIRVAHDITATVRVNGGAPQATVPSARAPFILGAPYLRTSGFTFNWSHAPIVKGDSVEVTACAVVNNNTAEPACWSRTTTALR